MSNEVLVSYYLRYRTSEGERGVTVDATGVASPASAVAELGLTTVRGPQTRRVRVCPTVPVTMTVCEAEISCDVSGSRATTPGPTRASARCTTA